MHKFLLGFFVICGLIAPGTALGQKYVRKQLEPAFFIPEGDKSKPEKLPMPKYYSGEAETIKAVENEWGKSKPIAEQDSVLDNLEDTPEYQQKFDEYSNDLDHIGKTGEIPANENLENDLSEMSSNERRQIESKPGQKRNVKAEFDRALQKSLNDGY